MKGDIILEVKGLGAHYLVDERKKNSSTHEVFEGVSFALERGEFVSVVGPSGCGKTTLLHILAGLKRPSAGEVGFVGQPRQAVMFQRPTLVPWRRILGNVLFGAECMGLEPDEEQAFAILETVGLADVAKKYPHQLSEGMKQRVNLARALHVQPDILLLDEPFAALDITTRRNLQQELLAQCESRGVTVLHVSHNLEDVVMMADRVLVFGGSPANIVNVQRIELVKPRVRGAELWKVLEQLEVEASDAFGQST